MSDDNILFAAVVLVPLTGDRGMLVLRKELAHWVHINYFC